jgi:hypothetical protein
MRYLCEIYTTGGPVAVIQQQYLPLWDGNEDYFAFVIDRPRSGGWFERILDFKKQCTLCLIPHESDGNFHLYHDRENLVVLSEIYAEDGFEIARHLPPIRQAVVNPPVPVPGFGGRVVVFDSAIPGHAIDLREPGRACVVYGSRPIPHKYDAALVEVNIGDWQALELFLEAEDLSFNGVWFQRIP